MRCANSRFLVTYRVHYIATRWDICQADNVVLHFQLVELARVPKDVSPVILQHGIMVQLLTVSGTPKLDGAGNVINPLTGTEYRIRFTGEKGVEMESTMTLGRTIWFEGNMQS